MKRYDKDELLLIWLDSFGKISYENKQKIFSLIKGKSDIKRLISEHKEEIVSEIGDKNYVVLQSSAENEYFTAIIKGLDSRGLEVSTVVSDSYPELLKQTSSPPLVLYVKGNVKLLSGNLFGIVGSRKSLPLSLRLCEEYVKSLSEVGFSFVTGIAEGIDKTVIETALSNGGKVVSVLPGGFDHVYPKQHENLIKDVIAKGGAVITEYPPETEVMPYNFPVRNRIIAGLSKGVLIVSAGKKSGTLYTAEYAEEYGRDLFAIPYSVGIASGVGTNDLIKRGAILTDTPEDILLFYGIEEKKSETEELTDIEKAVVTAIAEEPLHIEKICEKTGKKVFEIASVLSFLEIKGIIVKAGINVYGLGKNLSEE